ncbi:MAG: ABC transporter permease [Clostridiales bacterium]|nr:ABC transporter permease [Clostridiales bacterium]
MNLRGALVRFFFAVQMAWHGVLSNPLRSILALLGVAIGVASVITLMNIGEGARHAVLEQFQKLGRNVIQIRAEDPTVPLDPKDADELLQRVEGLVAATPVIRGDAWVQWRWTRAQLPLVGVGDGYPLVRDQELVSGHFFTAFHVESRAPVAVLGHGIASRLMGGRSPVGHSITIGGKEFLIMGVLAPRGQDLEENVDEEIFIPYTVAQEILKTRYAQAIWVKAASPQDADLAVAQLGRIYRRKMERASPIVPAPGEDSDSASGGSRQSGGGYILSPGRPPIPIGPGEPREPSGSSPLSGGAKDPITITNMNLMVQEADEANRILTLLLGGIASVSLLVGGLGIMNIMLVAVSERTGEIGLRRALGAKRTDLVTQFLLEALYITLFGAVGGLALAVWATQLFAAQGFATVFSWQAVQVAVAVAVGAGLLFGVYPAIHAASLEPVEALRRR